MAARSPGCDLSTAMIAAAFGIVAAFASTAARHLDVAVAPGSIADAALIFASIRAGIRAMTAVDVRDTLLTMPRLMAASASKNVS